MVKPLSATISEPEQRRDKPTSRSENAHRQDGQALKDLRGSLSLDVVEGKAPSETSLRSLHPQVILEPLSKTNLPGFKRVNSTLLPIPYTRKFYDEIFTDPVAASITLVAVWNDDTFEQPSQENRKVVGGIRCRILHDPSTNGTKTGKPMLYISTMTLLSPYRHLGIAAHLLARVERVAREKYRVGAVGAHVWVANAEGLEWYRKRGFEEVKKEEGYYSRLKPTGAVVVRKDIG